MSSAHFCASTCRFSDIKKLKQLPSESRARSCSIICAMTPFDGNVKIYKCLLHILRYQLLFQRTKKFNFFPSKSRSRSSSTIFAITPFDGKCQNLQMSSLHFLRERFPFQRYKKNKNYLKIIGQDNGVQFTHGRLPVTNTEVFNCNFFYIFLFSLRYDLCEQK